MEWEQAQVALRRAKRRLDQNKNQAAKLEAPLMKVTLGTSVHEMDSFEQLLVSITEHLEEVLADITEDS